MKSRNVGLDCLQVSLQAQNDYSELYSEMELLAC